MVTGYEQPQLTGLTPIVGFRTEFTAERTEWGDDLHMAAWFGEQDLSKPFDPEFQAGRDDKNSTALPVRGIAVFRYDVLQSDPSATTHIDSVESAFMLPKARRLFIRGQVIDDSTSQTDLDFQANTLALLHSDMSTEIVTFLGRNSVNSLRNCMDKCHSLVGINIRGFLDRLVQYRLSGETEAS